MNIVNIEITPPIPVSSNAHGKSYKESITESIKSLPTSAEGAIAHPPGIMINIFYKIVKSTWHNIFNAKETESFQQNMKYAR